MHELVSSFFLTAAADDTRGVARRSTQLGLRPRWRGLLTPALVAAARRPPPAVPTAQASQADQVTAAPELPMLAAANRRGARRTATGSVLVPDRPGRRCTRLRASGGIASFAAWHGPSRRVI